MKTVRVGLRPVAGELNMPTVIKTAVLPGGFSEKLFIATQVGEIFYIENGSKRTFLDIRPLVIKLGISNGRYDERGLLGLAFHPDFHYNGLFYIHYSVAGTQGPGALPGMDGEGDDHHALPEFFAPDPCEPGTLSRKWSNRDARYDHIDTVEEWSMQWNGRPQKRRTLLNLRRPFFNHNGVNSLNFSPETGKLVLTTGDGGSGYDPFDLSQDDMEIAGKIIEIDTDKNQATDSPPVVTRFDELPAPVQDMLTVTAKGVRNIPGISYRRFYNRYVKYAGFVGQDLTEAIFSFVDYVQVPVTRLVQDAVMSSDLTRDGFINFGWRGWEGAFPTMIIKECPADPGLDEKAAAYYSEAVKLSTSRLLPLTSYFHRDPRPDKFSATALTGVQPYMGTGIPDLTGSVVFTDFARGNTSPVRGALAYTRESTDRKLSDYGMIEPAHDFGSQDAFFSCLGTNSDQTRLFLGVYGSMNVTDLNLGSVFEIVPR